MLPWGSIFIKLQLAVLLCFSSIYSVGQNLIANPSAESGDPATNGWTTVSIGTSCFTSSGWRVLGNQNGFPVAQLGSYFFYAGCSAISGPSFELKQDIDVASNAVMIDAGLNSFTFSGYMQVFTQATPDQSQMIVEYRNAVNNTVLTSYNTGLQSNQGIWTNYLKTTTAPIGTRHIRIRLISVVNNSPSVDGYFDDLSLTSNIPLPLIFVTFNAIQENNIVRLTWVTASEINNSYFTVQRSQIGTAWQDVENINGRGNNNTDLSYTAIDNNLQEGISYYRIKQTDIDDKSTYSEIKEVNLINGFGEIRIFPNPVKSVFTIDGNRLKNAQVIIYNSIGEIITLPTAIRSNTLTINASGLSKGVYFIRIRNSSGTQLKKIIVE